MDKSSEFPYSELAEATRNFSLANKIGEGESGSVYYAELRGEVSAAIQFYNIVSGTGKKSILNHKTDLIYSMTQEH